MKTIFVLLILCFSFSALASKIVGRIEEREYSNERCDVTVKKIGRGKNQKLQVQVYALGESFRIIIGQNTSNVSIKTKSLQIPRSDISGKGTFDQGRPVSLQLDVTHKLDDYSMQDSINCTFP